MQYHICIISVYCNPLSYLTLKNFEGLKNIIRVTKDLHDCNVKYNVMQCKIAVTDQCWVGVICCFLHHWYVEHLSANDGEKLFKSFSSDILHYKHKSMSYVIMLIRYLVVQIEWKLLPSYPVTWLGFLVFIMVLVHTFSFSLLRAICTTTAATATQSQCIILSEYYCSTWTAENIHIFIAVIGEPTYFDYFNNGPA